jgi:hypothetical protein
MRRAKWSLLFTVTYATINFRKNYALRDFYKDFIYLYFLI